MYFKTLQTFFGSPNPQNLRLRPVLNPHLLCITRTKSGFYAEFGPDMQESCFGPKVSVFLGPSSFKAKIAAHINLCVVIRIDFRVKPLVALLAAVRQDTKHGQDNSLEQPFALRSTNFGRAAVRASGFAPNVHIEYSTADFFLAVLLTIDRNILNWQVRDRHSPDQPTALLLSFSWSSANPPIGQIAPKWSKCHSFLRLYDLRIAARVPEPLYLKNWILPPIGRAEIHCEHQS